MLSTEIYNMVGPGDRERYVEVIGEPVFLLVLSEYLLHYLYDKLPKDASLTDLEHIIISFIRSEIRNYFTLLSRERTIDVVIVDRANTFIDRYVREMLYHYKTMFFKSRRKNICDYIKRNYNEIYNTINMKSWHIPYLSYIMGSELSMDMYGIHI
ncbi:MAG: hypothetical protein QXE05_08990 [Nitrososphaeria archaeon]